MDHDGMGRMRKVIWACDACGQSGHVIYDRGDGAYGVVTRIRDGHRASSSDCQDGWRVRVVANDIPVSGAG